MNYPVRWQPCVDTARSMVRMAKAADRPVWLDQIVDEILKGYPGYGLTPEHLREIVSEIVIQERWSLAA